MRGQRLVVTDFSQPPRPLSRLRWRPETMEELVESFPRPLVRTFMGFRARSWGCRSSWPHRVIGRRRGRDRRGRFGRSARLRWRARRGTRGRSGPSRCRRRGVVCCGRRLRFCGDRSRRLCRRRDWLDWLHCSRDRSRGGHGSGRRRSRNGGRGDENAVRNHRDHCRHDQKCRHNEMPPPIPRCRVVCRSREVAPGRRLTDRRRDAGGNAVTHDRRNGRRSSVRQFRSRRSGRRRSALLLRRRVG